MSEQAESETEPEVKPQYDPGPDFKAKVKEVLEELGLLGDNKEPEAPSEPPKSKVRTLRQEEADSEFLVNKVLDKLKSAEPPAAKKEVEKPKPEVSPGPPPKKSKIRSAMWG